MRVTAIRNLRYIDSLGKALDLEVQFEGSTEWAPFTYVPGDTAESTISVAYLLAGVTTDPAPYVPPTDDELRALMPALSPRQFRAGLILNGILLSAIDAALAAISDATERALAINDWDYASSFARLHPLVVKLSAQLKLTPLAVDALWRQAVTL